MGNVPPGYHGRYLRVDLSSREAVGVSIPRDVLRQFIGGAGLGTWILLRETPDGVEPLSPTAPLLFVFSPLVGSPLTTSAKFVVMGKSPLTQRINDSLSSSHFAIAGKKTGYDAIVIVGVAERPTCLVIEPDQIRYESAGAVWGLSSRDAAASLRKKLGQEFRVAGIGPAGENLVRYATVSHDGRHAGRGGMGAVMGAKMLKAVAVRGDRLAQFYDIEGLITLSKELSEKSFGPATAKYRELGTAGNLLVFNRLAVLPTRNFQTSTFAGAGALAPEALADSHPKTQASCAACTIGCEHIYQIGPKKSRVRMEYENLFALGPLCGISDPDIVLRASSLCDELGMDTISAGATIAFAMECAERGYLDAPQLRFGDGEALLDMLEKIAARKGLGDLLAEGSRSAAEHIGHNSTDFAPHVKGLEIPGYEPRAMQAMALGFAVGARGADHNRSGAYEIDFSAKFDRLNAGIEVVAPAIETENRAAIMDSLILCKFLRGVFTDYYDETAEMLNLVTGFGLDADEMRETACRILTARKWYNIRQGWTPAEDTLPKRFLAEKLPEDSGPSAGAVLSGERLAAMVAAYNIARGWEPGGAIPIAELQRWGFVTGSLKGYAKPTERAPFLRLCPRLSFSLSFSLVSGLMNEEKKRPRSVQAIGWCVAVVSFLSLAYFGWAVALPYQKTQQKVVKIEELQAICITEKGGPDWLRNLIGDAGMEIFDKVVEVDISNAQEIGPLLGYLGQLPDLRSLDLSGRKLTKDSIPQISASTSIQSLILNMTPADDPSMAYIKKMKQLTHLELNATAVTDKGLAELTGLTNMKMLALARMRITDQGVSPLLGAMPKLERLQLKGSPIGKNGLENIDKLANLSLLNVESTQFDDAGMKRLAGLTKIEQLNLSVTRITDAGMEALRNLTSLQILHLNGTSVGDRGADSLKGLTKIRVLSLGGTQVGNEGLSALSNLRELNGLDLSGTQVTDAGLQHLTSLKELKSLSLSVTKITDHGVKPLGELEQLQSLALARTQITGSSLDSLASLENLAALNLRETKINDEGIAHLGGLIHLARLDLGETLIKNPDFTALKKLDQLRVLSLFHTDLSGEALRQLPKAFPNLVSLDVVGCPLTAKIIRGLKSAMPNCNVIVEVDEK